MLRRATLFLVCALLGAQEGPWLRDRLADRYPGPFPPETLGSGVTGRTETRPGRATVFIVDAAPAWERFQTFHLELAGELKKVMLRPPPSLHSIELSDFMSSDPSHPGDLDIKRAIHALTPPAVPAYLSPPR